MVEISSTAVAEIDRLKRNRQMTDSSLRLIVKSGGCLDFFYALELEDNENQVEDNSQSDRILEVNGVSLVVDPQSWKYIEHLKLDYSEDLMGGGFRFHNPQMKKTCGCGISFTEVKQKN